MVECVSTVTNVLKNLSITNVLKNLSISHHAIKTVQMCTVHLVDSVDYSALKCVDCVHVRTLELLILNSHSQSPKKCIFHVFAVAAP